MVREISQRKYFCVVNTWQRLKQSTLNVEHTFLNNGEQKPTRVFSNNESFVFYCNNSTSFESVLIIQKMFEKIKKIVGTVLFTLWLATYQCK